jgi:hypothetical protein
MKRDREGSVKGLTVSGNDDSSDERSNCEELLVAEHIGDDRCLGVWKCGSAGVRCSS